MRIVKSVIQPNECNQSIDQWLAKRFTYRTIEQWRQEITHGRLEVGGQTASSDYILQKNDLVRYFVEEVEEPEVCKEIEILYEDDFILVVNKPGNLPCHPSGKFFRNTLWYILQVKHQKIHLIHRLDRDTSGLLVIGKTKFAARKLGKQFMNRQLLKNYQLIVHGELQNEIDATGWLIKDVASEIRKKRIFTYSLDEFHEHEMCETSSTQFKPVRSNGSYTLVDVKLGTGRFHQIRATISSLGFPVVGDKIYGLDENIYLNFVNHRMTQADSAKLVLTRQALHASHLCFNHPEDNRPMEFYNPIDNNLLKQLELEN